ncbi:MAG: exodeoxyribonuclease VII small subunit [Planctomycetota bacterium]
MTEDDETPEGRTRDEEDGKGFEDHLSRLEEAVAKLEEGDLTLDESLELYEEGINAYRRAHEILEDATGKIQKLMESVEGELEQEPFERAEGENE